MRTFLILNLIFSCLVGDVIAGEQRSSNIALTHRMGMLVVKAAQARKLQ